MDLCHIFCAEAAALAIKCYSPELIVHPVLPKKNDEIENTLTYIEAILPRLDALVIGPGLGRNTAVLEATKRIISLAKGNEMTLVLDGDALFLLAGDIRLIHGYKNAILIPNIVSSIILFFKRNFHMKWLM